MYISMALMPTLAGRPEDISCMMKAGYLAQRACATKIKTKIENGMCLKGIEDEIELQKKRKQKYREAITKCSQIALSHRLLCITLPR